MARLPKFAYVVDSLLEDFEEALASEISDEHMPMASDSEDKKFNQEYVKAMKYAIKKIEKQIKTYES